MKDLSGLSDEELSRVILELVTEERRVTTRVLWHLYEVQRRRLFARLGYPSLFEYGVKSLGYSGSAVGRRISAMRLLVQVPDMETALQSGELSLSTLCAAQQFMRRAKLDLPRNEKRELLKSLAGKSRRECERIFATLAPEVAAPDKERRINATQTEICFIADDALLEKFDRIKNLDAHRLRNPTYLQLFHRIADLALRRLDPTHVREKRIIARTASPGSRGIPKSLRRAVWIRDQGRCVYRAQNGNICGSKYALEIDHVIPAALNGESSLDNLRLLCRTHNQQAAIEKLGAEVMGRYIKT